jgi:hypothetical protein
LFSTITKGGNVDARTYYKQHPEDILYYDEQVIVTLSNRGTFVELRDPGTLKTRYTLSYEALRTIWNWANTKAWREEHKPTL